MPSLNRVLLIGRLTRDPELRYTASGLAMVNFSIAVDRFTKDPQTGEKKTDFFRCTAWRQKAEFVSNYIQKGRLVAVEGRIEIDEVAGQDGQKKFFTNIVCDGVELLDSNRDTPGEAAPAALPAGNGRAQNGAPAQDENGYFPDDEPAPARPPQRAPQAQAAPPRERPAPAPAAAAAPRAAAPERGGGGRPAPAPAMPADDDFDDSDPFADE